MLLIPFCPLTTAKVLALKATILVLLTPLIKAKVRITALAGLVLQLLKSWCAHADGQGFGLGFQVAGTLSLQAEHDLTQGGYLPLAGSILGLRRRERRCGRIRASGPTGTCPCRLRRANPAQQPAVRPPARP
jgi:hypothetical protein